jgi:hypothetical protein
MRTCHKTLGYLLRKAPHPGKRILSRVAGLQRRLICFHLPTTADMRSGTERALSTNANSAVTELPPILLRQKLDSVALRGKTFFYLFLDRYRETARSRDALF